MSPLTRGSERRCPDDAYGGPPADRQDWAGLAERGRPGGTEGAAALMRRGLPGSADTVEWRRSPRSSSDPNKGSWRGCRPAGYEVGKGCPCLTELHLGPHERQHGGE